MTAAERASARAALAPGTSAGVTEPMIEAMVRTFYSEIRRDPLLGPIFAGAIGEDWEPHQAKMSDFWSSVLLMSGRFKGSPMAAHVRLSDIGPQHFERWLDLFRRIAAEVCPEPAAALFIAKAEMIAGSLQLGIAASRGELPPVSATVGRRAPGRNRFADAGDFRHAS